MSDWTRFGRVDADGTVWVKTATGERAVGSWQAGPPEEGLAHFARRFEDLVVEVDLLESRLSSGVGDPSQTGASIRRLLASLPEAAVVGDVDGLTARLEKLAAMADERAEAARQAREAARAEAVARKTALVEEAEKIAAESTSWKAAGDRLREILEEWRTIRGADRKTDAELWRRYAAARDAFARRRGAHFASLDAARKEAQAVKEELVAEAESLADSTDWNGTAERLKELMNRWRSAPRASREVEQRLWERFRAAQDAFFTRRSEYFAAREAEHKENLRTRQELVAEAEALDIETDPRAAQQKLRDIMSRWHAAGRVRRDALAPLERRLRAIEEAVREAMDSAWRRTSPKESPLLAQMRGQVAEAEERLRRARAAGDEKRIAEAERALESKRRVLELAEQAG